MDAMNRTKRLLFCALVAIVMGCNSSTPPAASISAPKQTPQMKAAAKWLLGSWNGQVIINRQAAQQSPGITEKHVASIEAATMQFHFQDNGKVAMSASVPTPQGPAARNALADWYVQAVDTNAVTLRTKQSDAPMEEVVITREGPDQFTMPAPESFGSVRFRRAR